MIRKGAALVAALLLASCGEQQTHGSASPAPQTHDEVRLAFRATFLRSCLDGIAGPRGQTYCSCTDDGLEGAFDDAGLARLTPDDPKFRAIAHECARKAGLAIRPGH